MIRKVSEREPSSFRWRSSIINNDVISSYCLQATVIFPHHHYVKFSPLSMTNLPMISLMASIEYFMIIGEKSRAFTVSSPLEMIAEIDTDSSGTVDFDGKFR
jgi:hypothetical protein